MTNILLLNDFSATAEHALAYAQNLAQSLQANLLVWNLKESTQKQSVFNLITASLGLTDNDEADQYQTLSSDALPGFEKDDTFTCLSPKDTEGVTLHQIVQEHNIDLIVKGTDSHAIALDKLTTQFLTKTLCPVLMVPQQARFVDIKQMVYLTDLRYCRTHITGYLKQMAKQLNAGLALAHITAAKLPEPETNYALSLFRKAIGHNPHGLNLSFQHITEPCINKVADVLIEVLNNDWLAMAYGKHHHTALNAACNKATQNPAEINVPLLLFNC